MRKTLFLLTFILLSVGNSYGQTPALVKDIYPLDGSGLGPFAAKRDWATVVGNKLIFQGNNSTHGAELWMTDGTEAGTIMLKDISPGDRQASSNPGSFFTHNGVAYFAATIHPKNSLWRTDGTEKGTYVAWEDRIGFQQPRVETSTDFYYLLGTEGMVRKDPKGTGTAVVIGKHLSDEVQNFLFLYGPETVARLGNKWLFLAEVKRERIRTLMVTDETRAGTYSLNTGVEGLTGRVEGLHIEQSGNQVFFVNDDGRTGAELWVTDGSQAGTRLVKNIGPGGVGAKNLGILAAVPKGLVFTASDGTSGSSIWFSDGTESGTKPIKLPSEPFASTVSAIYGCTAPTTGDVYFLYYQAAKFSLWRTNGTAAGTTPAFELPQGNTFAVSRDNKRETFFLSVNGSTYFLTETYSTDGTSHNVWRIDERTGTVSKAGRLIGCASAPYFQIMGNHLYYVGANGKTGNELWKVALSQQAQKK